MWYWSDTASIYYLLPLIGLVVGLLGSLLGGGGGFVFLPLLTLVVGVPAQTAVVTSLVATLPVCIAGSVAHYRRGNIDFKVGAVFALSGIIGAVAGAFLSQRLSPLQLKTGFGAYAVFMALKLFWDTRRKKEEVLGASTARQGFFRILYGLVAGGISGTFGTSGTAPVMAGLFSLRLGMKVVIGTSLLVVLVNTVFATSAHFLLGRVDLTLVTFLTAGSALGAVVGPRLLVYSERSEHSEPILRYGYALAMLVLGLLMIVK